MTGNDYLGPDGERAEARRRVALEEGRADEERRRELAGDWLDAAGTDLFGCGCGCVMLLGSLGIVAVLFALAWRLVNG